jgi:hypothetical protein
MSVFNEKKWQADKSVIARRLTPESLPGLLKKYLKVPRLCRAYVTMPRGGAVVKDEASETVGISSAVLIKTRKFNLDFDREGLVTDEGYVSGCTLTVTFMVGDTDFHIEQVAENLLEGRDEVSITDIHSFFCESVEELLENFVSKRGAEEICLKPVVEDLEKTLRATLKKYLYRSGLVLCGIGQLEFDCPEFESLQRKRSKIKEKEEVLRSRSKLDDLEMEKKIAHIQRLKEVGVDPNVAAEIELGRAHFNASRAKLLLVASGKGIGAYAPYSEEPAKPENVYLLPNELGFARSATVAMHDGEPVVAAGAQQGVYLASVKGDFSAAYYIETSGRPRGGFNSVAVAGTTVYASHSELGLLCWEDAKESGKPVFPEITRAGKYIRGVCVHKRVVYFSSGTDVYAFEPGLSEIKATYRNGRTPITALLVAGDSIFAGNQAGEVLHWVIDYPERAARVLLRRQGTIYSVGKMNTDKGRFLLVGARDYSVSAFDPLSGAVRQYISPDFLRWVDGAGDYVFASSYSGHRVFIWGVNQPAAHLYSIPLDEMAQDIYVWEEGPE